MNEFLQSIEEFLKETGMSATAFGIKTKKNPRLVHDLRKGAGCTMATVEECNIFMANYRKNNEREKNGKQN